ncbi:major facilitator superfamily domain-containing protein [Desarmillaria tabescens]|uniref:Major facilitator superfamily domain-containing protein n=1 Tax=Armillaria tabescens TaxID=1929756 RepID=A0AA39JN64_ARMTA|nr:major facilitator superfamily domain-containing protein [Desarmillaria tabescens]KAK0444945.1 major facilitator superfamily domain-containing protein [Desarmillaria tabescens]
MVLAEVARVDVAHVAPAQKQKRTWKDYIWASKPRKLLTDLILITFGFLGTWIKYLDKSNLQTAFVSGMKEDLGFYGNQLNYANTAYSIASIIGLWPANMIMARVSPKVGFFRMISSTKGLREILTTMRRFLEIGWTISTFCQAQMTNTTQMCAIRALVGLFETGLLVMQAWYKDDELGRRIALINTATAVGPMCSSYLQAAIYKPLNGRFDHAGWQWSLPSCSISTESFLSAVIIPQLFLLPDVPARQTPNWMFTAADIELARDRNPREGRVKQDKFTSSQIRTWFLRPEILLLWLMSWCNSVGSKPQDSFSFWFKGYNSIKKGSFTVQQINVYPTFTYLVTFINTLIIGWTSDTIFNGRRWPPLCVAATLNAIVAGDPGLRSFASAGLNVASGICTATIPLALFQTKDQPAVTGGNWAGFAFSLFSPAAALTLAWYIGTIHYRDTTKMTKQARVSIRVRMSIRKALIV